MKILLAPSETKKSGGKTPFRLESLLFASLTPHRKELLDAYQRIVDQGDMQVLSKMFGLKKESDIQAHCRNILASPAMKAIERYTGVAFDHLNYASLGNDAKHYVDTHVILHSNLFGFLRANDLIPEYRLKQGEAVGDIKVDAFYRKHGAPLMEAYLKNEEILDLRAGYYDKFYKPKRPYMTLKFLKEGKAVSHWAKAYRGLVLRAAAQAQVESLDDFLKLPIEGLRIEEIQTKGNKTEVIYAIAE